MMKFPALSPAPNEKETAFGLIWLATNLLVMPSVFAVFNGLLPSPLSMGMLNVLYYAVNCAVTVFLLRKYLLAAWRTAMSRPAGVVWWAILGYLGYQTLTGIVTTGIVICYPNFTNVNDQNIFAMLEEDTLPLALATVFLVPLTEETLYRGLIFRKLLEKNRVLAFVVSMLVFAAIHVMGYIGTQPPAVLFLCFLQYLPAGFCLGWCYLQTGTILTPILTHTLVNAVGICYALR